MKLKKRIKQLESELKELKSIVKKSSIILIDEFDPTMRIELIMKNGDFIMQKVTKTITETPELIFKDNK